MDARTTNLPNCDLRTGYKHKPDHILFVTIQLQFKARNLNTTKLGIYKRDWNGKTHLNSSIWRLKAKIFWI